MYQRLSVPSGIKLADTFIVFLAAQAEHYIDKRYKTTSWDGRQSTDGINFTKSQFSSIFRKELVFYGESVILSGEILPTRAQVLSR